MKKSKRGTDGKKPILSLYENENLKKWDGKKIPPSPKKRMQKEKTKKHLSLT
jgi:hypothetical protein